MADASRREVAGAIIAGGLGSRMDGRDKGLLLWQQQQFAALLAAQLRPYVSSLIINCNRNEDAYRQLADVIVRDSIGGFPGPLAGLDAILSACGQASVLISPCDTPRLSSVFTERMLAMAQQHPDTLIVASDGQRTQPLHLILPKNLQPSIREALSANRRSVYRWLESQDFLTCNFGDLPEMFDNINEPGDLDALNQMPSKG